MEEKAQKEALKRTKSQSASQSQNRLYDGPLYQEPDEPGRTGSWARGDSWHYGHVKRKIR